MAPRLLIPFAAIPLSAVWSEQQRSGDPCVV